MKQHEFEATLTEIGDLGCLFGNKITLVRTNGSYYYWTDSLGVIIRPEPSSQGQSGFSNLHVSHVSREYTTMCITNINIFASEEDSLVIFM